MRHLYSRIMLFSGANPTQALIMFSSIARCFDNAFTTGVPGGTCKSYVVSNLANFFDKKMIRGKKGNSLNNDLTSQLYLNTKTHISFNLIPI